MPNQHTEMAKILQTIKPTLESIHETQRETLRFLDDHSEYMNTTVNTNTSHVLNALAHVNEEVDTVLRNNAVTIRLMAKTIQDLQQQLKRRSNQNQRGSSQRQYRNIRSNSRRQQTGQRRSKAPHHNQ